MLYRRVAPISTLWENPADWLMTTPRDVTQLLEEVRDGARPAVAALNPRVYDELRRLAKTSSSTRRPDQHPSGHRAEEIGG
jgi:hypothetical protein